ncbi:MAG: c-type cytochrome [Verrucomicrobiota bacterium]
MNRLPRHLLFLLASSLAVSAHPIVAGFERFYATETSEARAAEGGLLLLNELNCVACHAAPDTWAGRLPGRGKISLAAVGTRWRGEGLGTFVATPHQLKPGTLMPQIGGDAASNDALIAYLASLAGSGDAGAKAKKTFPSGNAQRGQKLFNTVGCVACHAPTGEQPAGHASVPLGLAKHYDQGALAEFIQNPLHTRPGGRMPSTELKDGEAADLAAFLNPTPPAAAGARRGDVAAGKAQFTARNCAACHDTGDKAAAATAKTAKPLAQVRAGEGCLAASPTAGVPNFFLSDAQRRAFAAALKTVQAGAPASLSAEQRVAVKFEQLNCYACHEWRGKGGAGERAKLFTAEASAVDSLGEIGYLPPKLDTAGRKLTTAWLEKLFWGSGGGVRPYMHTRMPRFGEAAVGDLIPLLAEACRPEKPREIDTSGGKGHQRFYTGRTLLGTNTGGLGCVACHGFKKNEPSGVRAINLTHTAKRVNPEYFMALLLDPQGTQPGTIMPPLLAGRKDGEKVVESMWTYFKELDQSEVVPEGLSGGGSFELKPGEEKRPIVFRTFLEGAGTQAIAVGFPAGIHAAFDAYEVHWALVWKGRYLDALTNWEERPMKPIKPLGEAKRMLPNHVPFAQLADASAAWPAKFGRYAGYTFKGYRLAPDGTPTFRYAIGTLEVEDTLRPAADGTFKRTVKVSGGNGGDGTWYFRGAGVGVSPQPVVWKDGTAVIEETLSL